MPTSEGLSKRKSPFVKADSVGSDDELKTEEQTGTKHARLVAERTELPPLLENECELVCDVASLIAEVDELETHERKGVARVEAVSQMSSSGDLRFELVVYLTRMSRTRSGSSFYELGVYVRACPQDPDENTEWTYKGVSFMVMLINVIDPFSDRSVVRMDSSTFRKSDPCRGWPCMVSFSNLEELETEGFLLPDRVSILCRSQTVFESQQSLPSPHPIQYRGLENQGATCYLNGLLQSLFHIGRLREIFYSVNVPPEEQESILTAIQTVFYDLESNPRSTAFASSEPLTQAFGWSAADVGIQQDVQEMNRVLMDKLELRLKPFSKDEDLRSLFCGKMENYIRCTDIDFSSLRSEIFYDIQLNGRVSSIEEALREYLSVEVLEGSNAYDAGETRGKQRAEKGVRFTEIPPVLTFQIMRFQFDFETLEMTKINSRFEFGETLDMNSFCANGGVYRLYSVLVHSGGVDGGHYYAFVRPGGDGWFKFDDTVVEQVNASAAVEDNFGGCFSGFERLSNYLNSETPVERPKQYSAYMLMYVREEMESSLLKPVRLAEVNPGLAEILFPPKTVRIIDLRNLVKKTTILPWEIPEEWITGEMKVKDMFDDASVVALLCTGEGRFSEIESAEDLGDKDGVVILGSRPEGVPSDHVAHIVMRFDGVEFVLEDIRWFPQRTVLDKGWWRVSGRELVEVQSTNIDSKNDRDLLVWAEEGLDPREFVETRVNTHNVKLVIHAIDRPWVLGGVPAIPGALMPSTRTMDRDESETIEIADFDCRHSFEELLKHVHTDDQILVFLRDPLMSDCFAINHDRVVRDFRTHVFHLLLVGNETLLEDSRPACVRIFNDHVVEVESKIVGVSPDESVGNLILRTKPMDGRKYRLVEVRDCEIEKVFSENDSTTLISSLANWDSSNNIVYNSYRIEPDNDEDQRPVVWKCLHVDRSASLPFGHPFLLAFENEEDCNDESAIRALLCEKLNVPAEVVRTWKFAEEDGTLMVRHPHNPFIQHTTPRREKNLSLPKG